MTDTLPTTDDGEPDTEQLASDLGIDRQTPHDPVWFTHDTGTVKEVVDYDPNTGAVALQPTHDTQPITVQIEDLWRNFVAGDLQAARRVFLTDDEVVVGRQTLTPLADFATERMQHDGVYEEIDDAVEATTDALEDDANGDR